MSRRKPKVPPVFGANRGKAWEKALSDTHATYAWQGRAKIHKVDPPTRIVRAGAKVVKIIQLENPFLDFVGVLPGGRLVVMEAKSTEAPVLKLDNDSNGITTEQLLALEQWASFGALAAIVWGFGDQARLVPLDLARERLTNGHRSVLWAYAINVNRMTDGAGNPQHDWLTTALALEGLDEREKSGLANAPT